MTDKQRKAESYLKQVREMIVNYQRTLLEIEALEYSASGIGAIRYDKEHVDGGFQGDTMPDRIADIIEMQEEAEGRILEIESQKSNCYFYIKQMQNVEERVVLEWYYINAVSMQEIALKMHVSDRTAYYIRDTALESFGGLI